VRGLATDHNTRYGRAIAVAPQSGQTVTPWLMVVLFSGGLLRAMPVHGIMVNAALLGYLRAGAGRTELSRRPSARRPERGRCLA
jgi:hypothetical protein